MQYACSDIHGRFGKYQDLLRKLDLKQDDTLYIIGDMLDRGPDGLKILRDATLRPNVIPMLGNHEFSAAMCLSWLLKAAAGEIDIDDEASMRQYIESTGAWQADGGNVTLTAFRALSTEEQYQVLDDLKELDAYAETEAGGREFVLVHSTPCNFSPSRPLDSYGVDELLFARPDLKQTYYPDKLLVVGHTPTCYLRAKEAEAHLGECTAEKYLLDIFRKGNLIDIDCGCVFTGRLGCLCLDTLEEFYV